MDVFYNNLNSINDFLKTPSIIPVSFDSVYKQLLEERKKKDLKNIGTAMYMFKLNNYNGYLTNKILTYNAVLPSTSISKVDMTPTSTSVDMTVVSKAKADITPTSTSSGLSDGKADITPTSISSGLSDVKAKITSFTPKKVNWTRDKIMRTDLLKSESKDFRLLESQIRREIDMLGYEIQVTKNMDKYGEDWKNLYELRDKIITETNHIKAYENAGNAIDNFIKKYNDQFRSTEEEKKAGSDPEEERRLELEEKAKQDKIKLELQEKIRLELDKEAKLKLEKKAKLDNIATTTLYDITQIEWNRDEKGVFQKFLEGNTNAISADTLNKIKGSGIVKRIANDHLNDIIKTMKDKINKLKNPPNPPKDPKVIEKNKEKQDAIRVIVIEAMMLKEEPLQSNAQKQLIENIKSEISQLHTTKFITSNIKNNYSDEVLKLSEREELPQLEEEQKGDDPETSDPETSDPDAPVTPPNAPPVTLGAETAAETAPESITGQVNIPSKTI